MGEHPVDTQSRFWVEAEVCGRTEVGPTRAQHQDAIMIAATVGTVSGTRLSWSGAVPDTGIAFAVIDGMGGYAGGGDAAALAATALAAVELTKTPADWNAWFEQLSTKIAHAGAAWDTTDMGATAALLGLTPDGLVVNNVGDCRIYRVVGGHLGLLSVDDRTEDSNSSTVTQALSGSSRIDAHTWQQAYRGGPERYLLCSDGVWETLPPAVLRDLCTAERKPGEIVDAVSESIYAQHATDNCSVIVIDLTATLEHATTGAPEGSRTVIPVAIETAGDLGQAR